MVLNVLSQGLPADALVRPLVLGADPCRSGGGQKVPSADLDSNMPLEPAGWHVDGCVARRPREVIDDKAHTAFAALLRAGRPRRLGRRLRP